MDILSSTINSISPLNAGAMAEAAGRLDRLVKPIGSLGRLEDIAVKLAGIAGRLNGNISKKCVVVMAADNGICEEGVAASPQAITAMQSVNMTRGLTGISVLCRHASSDLKVVDIGIKEDYSCKEIINMKIRKGTWNFSKGPAMTREEAVRAVETGIVVTEKLIAGGYDLIGTGEMGIGNTSSSSAVIMSFTGCSAEEGVGKGAGLTEEGFTDKKRIISRAIEVNRPDRNDPLDVLAKVGGFDIAGLAGCFLAAASHKVPIVVDGFISAAAAMTAWKMNPLARDYMLPSHCSAEPGFTLAMKAMGLEPVLNLDMRLGEGSGCPLMFNVIEAALHIMKEMATFDEVEMASKHLVDIRPGAC